MKKENKKAKVSVEYRISDNGGKTWGSWSELYFKDMSTEMPKNIKKIRVFLKD